MESLKTLLVANRGEIATRLISTAKKLGIKTVCIYSEPDAASKHVLAADDAVLLKGPDSTVYMDSAQIIDIAKRTKSDAIIPGYGFLSENADFARTCQQQAIYFVGPKAETIEAFGLKHIARSLAEEAEVPIVPGSKDLIPSADEAVMCARRLGYPVMLKATGGGGGMGLVCCYTDNEVRSGFELAKSRGEALFKNAGVFIERYYAASHHIEVQIFGNGQGDVVHFGERECSIQRRHQKVIEECPSPYVTQYPGLRDRLTNAAVSLASSVNYESAGTVEYLVDDESQQFFFLEMNTRLQVEHGITEKCYDVDLVELMLKQADAAIAGNGGLENTFLQKYQAHSPIGAAIEARVYAENSLRDFAPSPGLLQLVEWASGEGLRIDTWVETGCRVSPFYDPLLAKVIIHRNNREQAIEGLQGVLQQSRICGPPTNLEFLHAIVVSNKFQSGSTLTSFLQDFTYRPSVIEVLNGGAYTLIQDLGRPHVGHGVPRAGAMDPLALKIANTLVGNEEGKEALEITLGGPELRFHATAVVSLVGAAIDAILDGKPFSMWTRNIVARGQVLKIGKLLDNGCRAYLGVFGGFSNVATYFGSKSTTPHVGISGYQGRQLAPGDLLNLTAKIPESLNSSLTIPRDCLPEFQHAWTVNVMAGPYSAEYLTPDDEEMVYGTEFKVSHNASRAGIRLIGPVPKWARSDGGDGGSHPSNIQEYGYSTGGLNWTGDEPCLLPMDSPNFGGFVSTLVVVKADWWKLGQLRPGATVRFRRISYDDAVAMRESLDRFIEDIATLAAESQSLTTVPFSSRMSQDSTASLPPHSEDVILWHRPSRGNIPLMELRQAGDDYLLLEFGDGRFDLNNLYRISLMEDMVRAEKDSKLSTSLVDVVVGCNSLVIQFDSSQLGRGKLISYVVQLDSRLGDLSKAKVWCRKFIMPLSYDNDAIKEANKRYMETQRPYATYLPDNLDFVARSNSMELEELKQMFLTQDLMAFNVGFFCGATVFLPVDPRCRIVCPKTNPSRTFTPEGTVAWGGSCMSIYPVDSPGGFQMLGRTVPYFDMFGQKQSFNPGRPWLFRNFDLISFYEVSDGELQTLISLYKSGRYEFHYDMVEFDMATHNKTLHESAEEVSRIRQARSEAQVQMIDAEKESLAKWRKEKSLQVADKGALETLLADPSIFEIDSPLDANVWKVQVKERDVLKLGQAVVTLEAMKLEVTVSVPQEFLGPVKVEKVLAVAGIPVQAGSKLLLVRKV